MTQTQPGTLACPKCNSTNGVPLSDGNVLCLDCRNEYNAAEAASLRVVPPVATSAPTFAPDGTDLPPSVSVPSGDALTVDDVLGPPDDVVTAEAAQARLADMIGTQVVLEGGQVATVVDFPDDDHMLVDLNPYESEPEYAEVSFNEVVRSVDARPPIADVPDDLARALANVNMTVAGLVMKAGLASIAGEYPNAELLTPPTGWLPLDVDGLPALEQGTAYAVAFIVHAFSIDRTVIESMADMLLEQSQATTEPTKGGTE